MKMFEKEWAKSWLLLVVLLCLVLCMPTLGHAAGYGYGHSYGYGHGYYGSYYPSYSYYSYPSYYGYGSSYYAPAYSSGYSCPSPAKVVTVEGGDTVDKLIKELTLRKLLSESGLGAPPPQPAQAYQQVAPQQGMLSSDELAQLRAILQQLRQQQQEKK